MERGAWLGLTLGVSIGAIYVLAQWMELKKKAQAAESKGLSGLLAGAVFRVSFLVLALLAALTWTGANKYWLAGSLALTYTAGLLWRMRQLFSSRK